MPTWKSVAAIMNMPKAFSAPPTFKQRKGEVEFLLFQGNLALSEYGYDGD